MIKTVVMPILFALFIQTSACSNEHPPEQPAATGTRSTKNYLTFLPAETNLVFYANLDEIRQTPIGAALRTEFDATHADEEDDYLDFVAGTGLDIKEDVYEIWLGLIAGEGDESAGGAIIKGKFDEDRIVNYMKNEHKGEVEETSYRDHKIYMIEEREKQVTFLDAHTVMVGDKIWMQAVLDQSANQGKNVLDNPIMSELMAGISDGNQMWGAFNMNELSDKWAGDVRKNSPFKGTESIENMKSFVFYSHFGDKADVFLKGNFATADEAKTLAEMLIGFKAMAKLMISNDRDAIDMLNDIEIGTDGTTLEISTSIDKEFVQKFKEKRKTFSGGPVKLL